MFYFLETPATSTSTPSATISKINKESVINKKKLDFAAHKHLKDEEMAEEEVSYEDLSSDELKLMIDERKKQLGILQRHEAEKQELTEFTAKWKAVGNDAVDELVEKMQSSREEIMRKLNLAQDLFDD